MTQALPDFDLEQYLPYQFAVITAQLSANLANRYRDKYAITVAEWRVLVNLAYSDSRSIRDIQWRVGMDKSKVSRAVSRLEAAGHLTKAVNPNDRRLLELSLTEKGYQLVRELVPLAEEFQDKLRTQLGPQFASLSQGLNTLMKEILDDNSL
ncbi:MarR family winged helix-turn-helix transcriptional regulator [Epibacterium ulvae]|uniref:MarR family winged helix-turn-helix transcriptional regulator n=1 Tax=Epibacterium ulvae TaxID=1156985 RepID=UPI00249003A6|nr:MarR family winged helix-turn-helix transcriptional regulator [Epibacterium ulvae]